MFIIIINIIIIIVITIIIIIIIIAIKSSSSSSLSSSYIIIIIITTFYIAPANFVELIRSTEPLTTLMIGNVYTIYAPPSHKSASSTPYLSHSVYVPPSNNFYVHMLTLGLIFLNEKLPFKAYLALIPIIGNKVMLM